MNRPDFLTAARNALAKHHPKAVCAFIAGSILRNQATATSDIDIVVLYDDAFQNIHRDSVTIDGWPIEFFVHNTKANDFFIEKDRQSGSCLLAHMLVTGVVLPLENALSQERRVTAQKAIDLGPPPLTDAQIEDRRYFITDSIDDLDTQRAAIERFGTLSRLYELLGDFYLRVNGQWSGLGKSLGRLLRQYDPAMAARFETAFAQAYQNDFNVLKTLTDDILQPYGGHLFTGYTRTAPDDWKDHR